MTLVALPENTTIVPANVVQAWEIHRRDRAVEFCIAGGMTIDPSGRLDFGKLCETGIWWRTVFPSHGYEMATEIARCDFGPFEWLDRPDLVAERIVSLLPEHSPAWEALRPLTWLIKGHADKPWPHGWKANPPESPV